jgi:hypothetical protein
MTVHHIITMHAIAVLLLLLLSLGCPALSCPS